MRVTTFSIGLAAALFAGCGHGEDFSGDRPLPSPLVGAACDRDSDCELQCETGGDFPGGFCTVRGCRANTDCPAGTVCINKHGGVCLYPCGQLTDCASSFLGRGGYRCQQESGYSTVEATGVRYSVCIGD